MVSPLNTDIGRRRRLPDVEATATPVIGLESCLLAVLFTSCEVIG
jgi:hypothetical protein